MAFLITYPEERVPEATRRELAQVTRPLYVPLRHLQAVTISSEAQQLIEHVPYVVVTSPFGLKCLLDQFPANAITGTVLVLSQKMAGQLKQHHFDRVRVAETENQAGLQPLLAQVSGHDVVWLRGNLSVKHNLLTRFPDIQTVQVYRNEWNADLMAQVMALIGQHRITRVLVTSPSSYQRLTQIMQKRPQNFDVRRYYTLGPSTLNVIQADGNQVFCPVKRQGVLVQSLHQMYLDEKQSEMN
ncbi:uroporphyrinogen-III synthase [Secundilactobacillus hailunensis]|uniref:Uroporphyrinogen-III synthase n=1 Tax=Secundilactobacillus hailunensis TaxID=2559923 RepID=A0ABW1T863_9LACO|nr:uroporphyrinogen-III synthase [Secundilactobacillus hailunensis]